ncbi:Hypothetical predicted protein, partial [Pelobates cultripes]
MRATIGNCSEKQQQRAYIHKVRNAKGKMVHTAEYIADAFQDFYSSLYNVHHEPPDTVEVAKYLTKHLDCQILQTISRSLEEPFSAAELVKAIRKTPQ